jgi:hypothetical protein
VRRAREGGGGLSQAFLRAGICRVPSSPTSASPCRTCRRFNHAIRDTKPWWVPPTHVRADVGHSRRRCGPAHARRAQSRRAATRGGRDSPASSSGPGPPASGLAHLELAHSSARAQSCPHFATRVAHICALLELRCAGTAHGGRPESFVGRCGRGVPLDLGTATACNTHQTNRNLQRALFTL